MACCYEDGGEKKNRCPETRIDVEGSSKAFSDTCRSAELSQGTEHEKEKKAVHTPETREGKKPLLEEKLWSKQQRKRRRKTDVH